ncbi:MAG: hypothetical protein WCO52_06005 [bacterium]
MTAQLSGTTSFNPDLNEILEEAFERCGAELRSGYDFRTAKRSLNLLLADWANKGINLWTLDTGSQLLTYNVGTYTLPVNTIDLLDHVIRTGTGTTQIDINITRISSSTYLSIPNKNATGRPIQVWINRLSGATNSVGAVVYPTINVWPLPDNSTTYTFVYTRLKRMQDAGDGINGQDIPFRFLTPMISGLAYLLSLKIPGADSRTAVLKAMYDEDWQWASDEDREKAAIRFVPRESFLR